eukprot:scaffold7956_cov32-Tisochrysis_lutea.AAC.4
MEEFVDPDVLSREALEPFHNFDDERQLWIRCGLSRRLVCRLPRAIHQRRTSMLRQWPLRCLPLFVALGTLLNTPTGGSEDRSKRVHYTAPRVRELPCLLAYRCRPLRMQMRGQKRVRGGKMASRACARQRRRGGRQRRRQHGQHGQKEPDLLRVPLPTVAWGRNSLYPLHR